MFEPQRSFGVVSTPGATMNLRRRTGISDDQFSSYSHEDKSKTEMKTKIIKSIRNFDLYPKTDSVATKKTSLGGFVSLFAMIIITFLVGSALIRYLSVDRRDTLSVDIQVEDRVVIFFNITFPDLKCYDLHLDSVDASGDAAIDVAHHIHKVPVDSSGRITHLESKHKAKLGTEMPQEKYDPTKDPHSVMFCGSCYIEKKRGQCCNTCQDVMEVYKRHGLSPPRVEDIEQCLFDASKNHPGCNIYGTLDVQKVNGNFHFCQVEAFHKNMRHVVPHVTYPLDETVGIIPKIDETDERPPKTALFKYFVKVVPTTYKSATPILGAGLFSKVINTYQFSFTKHVMPFDSQKVMMLPGVFIVYNFEPIRITYEEFTVPFTHFLVDLLAVCAGVFVVLNYVDRLLEFVVLKLNKKQA
ncbi:hypothetical protein C9374_002601 [Naegleria lovaniensis]|uniref:Uncharacterized protein n=1 Tax=Naegleria lovaniensis TaxID=51637 RepID=A0AA88KJY5_NAELO|nr:uncharacterized protein C9374_002601 [Naegleria lovaniensis]KAG2386155.1 hypothetical protein C9374_002601 [Naegleria lovaniensis]